MLGQMAGAEASECSAEQQPSIRERVMAACNKQHANTSFGLITLVGEHKVNARLAGRR